MKAYSKLLVSLVPLVVAVLTALGGVLGDGHLSTVEVVQLGIAAATAFGVWASGYLPAGVVWPKFAVAGVLAGLNVLVTLVGNGGLSGVHVTEWINVVLAVLGALGVGMVPTVVAQPLNKAAPLR